MSEPSEVHAELTFRQATVDDIHQLCAFLEFFMEHQQVLRRTPEQIAGLLEYSNLAFHGERIVGFVAVEIYSHKMAEIQCLCVDPDFQRMGIGKRLVKYCVDVARDEGILELMAISASEHFLMDCGFDYSLPGQKRALFIQPQEVPAD